MKIHDFIFQKVILVGSSDSSVCINWRMIHTMNTLSRFHDFRYKAVLVEIKKGAKSFFRKILGGRRLFSKNIRGRRLFSTKKRGRIIFSENFRGRRLFFDWEKGQRIFFRQNFPKTRRRYTVNFDRSPKFWKRATSKISVHTTGSKNRFYLLSYMEEIGVI